MFEILCQPIMKSKRSSQKAVVPSAWLASMLILLLPVTKTQAYSIPASDQEVDHSVVINSVSYNTDSPSGSVTINYEVSYNAPPTVTANVADMTAGDVRIRYTLSDAYNDTLSLSAQYSTDGNSWSSATISGLTSWIFSAVLSDRLFMAGGANVAGLVDLDHYYDPAGDFWTLGRRIPTIRSVANSGVINDTLFVAGGVPYGSYQSASEGLFTSLPSIAVYQPTGVQSANVTVPAIIQDPDSSLVSLLVDYSTNSGAVWQAASVLSDTSDIPPDSYSSDIIWASGSDLADQEVQAVWFRVTPRDTLGTGVSDTTYIDIDNLAPQWVAAEGTAGDSTISLWYSEAVVESIATNTANYSISGGLTVASVSAEDTLGGSWETKASMPTERGELAAGVIEGILYVVGGQNGSGNTLEFYNPATDNWDTGTDMPTGREDPAGGVIDGILYVAGGYSGGRLSTLEAYNPDTDSWIAKSSMPTQRDDPAGGVIDGKFYVVGGGGDAGLSVLEVYDPATNSWTSKADMPTSRWSAEAGVINGKLYVVGGNNNGPLNTLEVYDPLTDSWSIKTPMPTARERPVVGVINGLLYVASGYDGDLLTVVEVYDPSSDTWRTTTSIPTARFAGAAGVIDNQLYVAGGGGVSGQLDFLEVYSPATSETGFTMILGSGEVLPVSPVTLQASNITDRAGNTAVSLDTTFTPDDPNRPEITVYQPTGVQAGDIEISFMISDPEGSLVGLLAEYSTDSGTSWLHASVSGDTSDIAAADYYSILVWLSGTDLADQELEYVWFRITPHDPYGWGTADTTYIDIDNKPPQWIAATGSSGDTTITFWFDELVDQNVATNSSNISLSGGLTIGSISSIGGEVDTWTTKASMPTARSNAAAGVVGGRLYVSGGWNGSPLSTLEVFDPFTNSWTIETSMPTARYTAGAGVINGKLYVVGGAGSGIYLGTLEVYDPSTDTWTTKASMPTAREGRVGVIDGKLYVVGGYNGSLLRTLEVYDPSTDNWTTMASMPTARYAAAAGAINGKMYVVGGSSTVYGESLLTTLEVYDPSTDSWTTKASMPTAQYGASAEVIEGKLWVVGGYGGAGGPALNTLEVYDPSEDSWATKASMPTARCNPAVGVIDGKLFVAGGCSTGDATSYNTLEVYTALSNQFILNLTSGQSLPSSETPVTLTATNIPDLYDNVAASLDTTFYPTSGEAPSISLGRISDTVSGDIPIRFQISDTEHNPVSLSAEYSTDGTTWLTASVLGNLASIYYSSYQDTLIWQSRTELAGQQFEQVWFKVTPRDNATTPGIPDSISFALDNKPPAWIAATGSSGDTTITFWFDELVDQTAATNTSDFALSSGLILNRINIEADIWKSKAAMPTARYGAAAGVIGGKLYVAGGFGESGRLSTLEVYDPATNSWTTQAPMPTARTSTATGVIDGKLYVAGGTADAGRLSTLEVYDPATNSWTTKASMPTTRTSCAAGVMGGKLYVVGGFGESIRLDTLEVYDPATNSWTTKTSMPTARTPNAIGVINGQLYVAGGTGDAGRLTTLEVYDPVTDSWTTMSPMTTARTTSAAGVINGRFYVAGGNGDSGRLNTLEVYDPAFNNWTTKASMLTASNYTAAGVMNGKLYVAGGITDAEPYVSMLEVYTALPDRFTLNLSSGQILPTAETPITLTSTNIPDLYGNVTASLENTFYPATGTVPSIALTDISGTVSGNVPVLFQISDDERNPVSLSAQYSTDGIIWRSASVQGNTGNIPSSGYRDTLIWRSGTDLPGKEYDPVWFKVVPRDNLTTAGIADSIAVHVDNNLPPTVTINGQSYSRMDSLWTFTYQLTDTENDTLSIVAQYSEDEGVGWHPATTTGAISGLVSDQYLGSIIWHTEQDIPGAFKNVQFLITPYDLDSGIADTAYVELNALGIPSLTILSDIDGEQTGDIAVEFQVDDVDGNEIRLVCEYRIGDNSWSRASVSGDTLLLNPTQYHGHLVWSSPSDLPGQDIEEVLFRITPRDPTNSGFPNAISFPLDNNLVPTVSIEPFSEVRARHVPIRCVLLDAEGDQLSLTSFWSADHGTSWHPMNLLTGTTDIGPSSYSMDLVWDSFADLGYQQMDSILVKLLPSDNEPGPEQVSSYLRIANYVGDYSGDVKVDFSDFATLVSAWNAQDTYHDIGPATGTVPHLVPSQDGKIDFEDLTIYLMMWNWSAANLPSLAATLSRTIQAQSLGALQGRPILAIEKREHPIEVVQRIPMDVWQSDDGLVTVDVRADRVMKVGSVNLTMVYDPASLLLLDWSPGPFLGKDAGKKGSLIKLERRNAEEGQIELLLGRIDPATPTASGSGVLATLFFRKLTKENSIVHLQYDLRNGSAESLSSGLFPTEIQALSIPNRFDMLQNYPNPFNGETIIRFQLPTAQRVRIDLYNVRGQQVATLVDREYAPGYHRVSWNGRTESGQRVASGLYFYVIQAGPNRMSKKLVILR